jgi:hypothetical protein
VRLVWIAEERVRVHLFVATLGYSRRMQIRPSLRERQQDWFSGSDKISRMDGDPGVIRTRDPRIRNPVLYPAELRGHPYGWENGSMTFPENYLFVLLYHSSPGAAD